MERKEARRTTTTSQERPRAGGDVEGERGSEARAAATAGGERVFVVGNGARCDVMMTRPV